MGRDFSFHHESAQYPVPPGFIPLPIRADLFLCQKLKGRSRNQLRKVFLDKRVLVGSRPVAPSFRLKGGETLTILLLPDERFVPPETIGLDIVYEDEHLLALNKQPGVMMHPAGKTLSGTMLNAIHHYFSSKNSPLRPVLLHRLDKNTSGLVMLAKHSESHKALFRTLLQRGLHKVYLAVCEGLPSPTEGMCSRKLEAVEIEGRKRMMVTDDASGLSALTAYTVLGTWEGRSLLGVRIFTGRQHQIRVHLASLGHPLLGDASYGGSRDFPRQALHSYYLGFPHPVSGARMELFADLPADMRALLPGLKAAHSHRSTLDTGCTARPWNPHTWLHSLDRTRKDSGPSP